MLPQAGLPGFTLSPFATGANITFPWNSGLLSIVTLPWTGASSTVERLQPGNATNNASHSNDVGDSIVGRQVCGHARLSASETPPKSWQGSLKFLYERAIHSIAQQPKGSQLEIFAEEVDGAIAEGEKRAAGVPTEGAIVGFDFVGEPIDLITREWKVSHAAHVAVDLVERFRTSRRRRRHSCRPKSENLRTERSRRILRS